MPMNKSTNALLIMAIIILSSVNCTKVKEKILYQPWCMVECSNSTSQRPIKRYKITLDYAASGYSKLLPGYSERCIRHSDGSTTVLTNGKYWQMNLNEVMKMHSLCHEVAFKYHKTKDPQSNLSLKIVNMSVTDNLFDDNYHVGYIVPWTGEVIALYSPNDFAILIEHANEAVEREKAAKNFVEPFIEDVCERLKKMQGQPIWTIKQAVEQQIANLPTELVEQGYPALANSPEYLMALETKLRNAVKDIILSNGSHNINVRPVVDWQELLETDLRNLGMEDRFPEILDEYNRLQTLSGEGNNDSVDDQAEEDPRAMIEDFILQVVQSQMKGFLCIPGGVRAFAEKYCMKLPQLIADGGYPDIAEDGEFVKSLSAKIGEMAEAMLKNRVEERKDDNNVDSKIAIKDEMLKNVQIMLNNFIGKSDAMRCFIENYCNGLPQIIADDGYPDVAKDEKFIAFLRAEINGMAKAMVEKGTGERNDSNDEDLKAELKEEALSNIRILLGDITNMSDAVQQFVEDYCNELPQMIADSGYPNIAEDSNFIETCRIEINETVKEMFKEKGEKKRDGDNEGLCSQQ